MNYNGLMKFRCALLLTLPLLFAETPVFASTSYSFGTSTDISLASETTAYVGGSWTEVLINTTNQNIDCVLNLADTTHICGNPGPSGAANVGIPFAPGNTAGLPTGTTSYLVVDGDNTWGAPVWTTLSGLTVNSFYTVSFYQSSNEENGNDQTYNDSWNVYLLPGASTGTYTPPGGDLAYSSPIMANPGANSTPWEAESFTFKATNATEVMEFVTNAVSTPTAGVLAPPFLDLAAVTMNSAAPEPGTWTLTLIGFGAIACGVVLRRRTARAPARLPRA